MSSTPLRHADTTSAVLGAAFRVYNLLGPGFVESVYAKALAVELTRRGVPFSREVPTTVFYDGVEVGRFIADFIVDGRVLVELKAVESMNEAHGRQVVNYLHATGLEVGLLINFGAARPQVRRFVGRSAAASAGDAE
jgi:GxxExxY protein